MAHRVPQVLVAVGEVHLRHWIILSNDSDHFQKMNCSKFMRNYLGQTIAVSQTYAARVIKVLHQFELGISVPALRITSV